MAAPNSDRLVTPEVYRQEVDAMWNRVWQLVCREREIPPPGDCFEYRILDLKFLVQRRRDGALEACSLNGHPCKVSTWQGFVFITLDEASAPLEEFLGSAATQLVPANFDGMATVRQATARVPCNWKKAIDLLVGGQPARTADREVYESVGIHSRSSVPPRVPTRSTHDSSARDFAWARFTAELGSLQLELSSPAGGPTERSSRDYFGPIVDILALAAGEGGDVALPASHNRSQCWVLFPNLCLQVSSVETVLWRVRPLGAGRCELDQILMRPVTGGKNHPEPVHEIDGPMNLHGMSAPTTSQIRHLHKVLEQFVASDESRNAC